MKTTIFTVVSVGLITLMAARSYGQAQVNFSNGGNAITFGDGLGTNTGLALYGSAGTYEYGLYMGPLGSTSISQMQLIDTVLSLNASVGSGFAGIINSGTINTPGNTANTLNFNSSTEYSFIVAAWTAASGNTYAAAVFNDPNVLAGMSAVGHFTPGPGGISPAAQAFGSEAGEVTTFSIAGAGPEPTTLALGGLGAAVLLLFCRRK